MKAVHWAFSENGVKATLRSHQRKFLNLPVGMRLEGEKERKKICLPSF